MEKYFFPYSLSFLFSLATIAAAAENFPTSIECDTPEEISNEIEYCTENIVAASSAENCYNKIVKAISNSGPELQKLLVRGKNTKDLAQEKSFNMSASDYATAEKRIDFLIKQSIKNLDRIADYPIVMLDDTPHVPCYLENAKRVKTAVENLDDRIDELKTANSALRLLKNSSKDFANDTTNLAPMVDNRSTNSPTKENSEQLVGQNRNRSDISKSDSPVKKKSSIRESLIPFEPIKSEKSLDKINLPRDLDPELLKLTAPKTGSE